MFVERDSFHVAMKLGTGAKAGLKDSYISTDKIYLGIAHLLDLPPFGWLSTEELPLE